MQFDQLKPNVVVRGPSLSEPVQIILVTPFGASIKIVGKGMTTSSMSLFECDEVAALEASPDVEPFRRNALTIVWELRHTGSDLLTSTIPTSLSIAG